MLKREKSDSEKITEILNLPFIEYMERCSRRNSGNYHMAFDFLSKFIHEYYKVPYRIGIHCCNSFQGYFEVRLEVDKEGYPEVEYRPFIPIKMSYQDYSTWCVQLSLEEVTTYILAVLTEDDKIHDPYLFDRYEYLEIEHPLRYFLRLIKWRFMGNPVWIDFLKSVALI